jgi:hypothetical protein
MSSKKRRLSLASSHSATPIPTAADSPGDAAAPLPGRPQKGKDRDTAKEGVIVVGSGDGTVHGEECHLWTDLPMYTASTSLIFATDPKCTDMHHVHRHPTHLPAPTTSSTVPFLLPHQPHRSTCPGSTALPFFGSPRLPCQRRQTKAFDRHAPTSLSVKALGTLKS